MHSINRFFSTLLASLLCLTAWSQLDYSRIVPHPRLLLPTGGEAEIMAAIDKYPPLATVHNKILHFCDSILTEPTVYHHKQGKRLLGVSRAALRRVYSLSYAYRMTHNENYARRAVQEMIAASRFQDWNPSHFLDVGEMTMALAIGYDWLYDYMSPSVRAVIRDAIVKNGLDAAEGQWFYNAVNNWNSVCNGGLVFGSLAIYEEIPQKAQAMIAKSLQSNPACMKAYAPDGGYPEGYGYWGYGTSFEAMMIAALESALGSDANLSASEGFMKSPYFMQYTITPSDICYNFSDCPTSGDCHSMMYWFAWKNNDPSILWIDYPKINNPAIRFEEDNRLLPSLLIFGSKVNLNAVTEPKTHFWSNHGTTPLFAYRSGWNSKKDTYFGIKGGSASTSHSHMDGGSFIFEKNGIRWSMELGRESYFPMESKGVDLWNMKQESQRWDIFRYSNQGHNTLTVNGQRHNVKGYVPITQSYQTKNKKGATLDLSALFEGSLTKAVRTATLDAKDNLTVVDQISVGEEDVVVDWIMVTPAEAKIIDKNTIELQKDGYRMLLKVSTSVAFEMKIWDNNPPHDYDTPNPNTVRVGFEAKIPAKKTCKFNVLLTEK